MKKTKKRPMKKWFVSFASQGRFGNGIIYANKFDRDIFTKKIEFDTGMEKVVILFFTEIK